MSTATFDRMSAQLHAQFLSDITSLRAAWVLAISGNNQTLGRPNGAELVWRALRRLSSPRVSTPDPKQWDSRWDELARFIVRNSISRPQVFIWAHSWGGDAAIDLCTELYKLGVGTDLLWLVDAVNRTNLFPTWLKLNPLSTSLFTKQGERPRRLGGLTDIKVPAGVAQVVSFHQTRDELIRGHTVVVREPTALIAEEVTGVDHGSIDTNLPLIERFVCAVEAKLGRIGGLA